MSKLQKSFLKPGNNSNPNTGGGTTFDFTSELNSKLSQLSINQQQQQAAAAGGSSTTSIATTAPIGGANVAISPSSPLSRQESRQNSLISFILNPEDQQQQQQGGDSPQDPRQAPLGIYGVEQLISSLKVSNKMKLSSQERDLIFSHLYRMLINGSNEVYLPSNGINEDMINDLLGLEPNINMGHYLWQVWLRCIVAMICIDIDSIGEEVVTRFLPYLLKWGVNVINNSEEEREIDSFRESLKLQAFATCLLLLYHDGENHNMLKNVAMMMLLLEGEGDVQFDDELIDSILDVIGISLGLAFESHRNCDDVILGTEDDVGLLDLLELLFTQTSSNRDLKIKIGTLVGLCYECYGGANNEPFNDLKSLLIEFDNEGVRKQGKGKGKNKIKAKVKPKETRNLIKIVINKIDNTNTNTLIDTLPLNKTKCIKIKSFIAYYRLNALKFALLGNVRVWVLKNRELRDMLRPQLSFSRGGDESDYDENDESDEAAQGREGNEHSSSKKLNSKERTKLIKRGRDIKNMNETEEPDY